jgi:hypothetical protein
MPDIGFEDIQQDVKRIRETLGDLKNILDQLNKPRSVVCAVINATDISLTLAGDHHDHGGFATAPPAVINPQSATAFGSQSRGGSLFTGTEGFVFYEGGGVRLKCYWDNPWLGENKTSSSLELGDPNHYLYWSLTGSGDQKAEMQFVLFQRPFQDAWRYCKLCHGMFFDGYAQKGICPGLPSRGVLEATAPGRSLPQHGHVAQGYNFSLPHDAPAPRGRAGEAQWDWRFCRKCDSMFYDGYTPKGVCAAGGGHEAQGFNFNLSHDIPGPGQPDWRFCHKCHILFYDGYPEKGSCPAGRGHEAQGFNFVLEWH